MMTTEKKEPGFFASVFEGANRSVRLAVARRCARAWEHGYATGQERSWVPEAAPSAGNPYLDRDGEPKEGVDGLPVVEPPDPDR